ncbi:Crossover junction endonuclease mus81 [Savitreella phatthalungensis]
MPNELYLAWLKEWKEKAFEAESKGYKTLKTAYNSMLDCDHEIGHPSQAIKLHGIGPVLCGRLEKRMLAHCRENNVPMPERPRQELQQDNTNEDGAPVAKKRKTSAREYIPQYRSGAFGLLVGMSDPTASLSMSKSDVVRLAKPLTDASFDVAGDSNRFFTAWNSMKTLIDRSLVTKYGNPPKYTLTETGLELSKRLRDRLDNVQRAQMGVRAPQSISVDVEVVDLAGSDESEADDLPLAGQTTVNRDSQEERSSGRLPSRARPDAVEIDASQIQLRNIPAGSYSVQLIIDNREVKTQRERDFIEQKLDAAGIALDARMLDVGDAVWIAKCQDGTEVVLDYVVERKRLDDLVSSIKDGRFKEQKFRLGRCGCEHVIYIIERYVLSSDYFAEAIRTSLAGAQVHDGCFVKHVKNLNETTDYLCKLTHQLSSRYAHRDLYVLPDRYVDSRSFVDLKARLGELHNGKCISISYDAYQGVSRKQGIMTVGDIWLKQLLCIRGLSLEKALEVRDRFPVMRDLMEAYRKLHSLENKYRLLHDTCNGSGRKAIGKALSRKVYELLHDKEPSK